MKLLWQGVLVVLVSWLSQAQLTLQYGLPFVQNIIALIKKQNVTVDELDALFNSVKPYEAYGIPDKVPQPNSGTPIPIQ